MNIVGHKRRILAITTSMIPVLTIIVGICTAYLGDYYHADYEAINAFLPQDAM